MSQKYYIDIMIPSVADATSFNEVQDYANKLATACGVAGLPIHTTVRKVPEQHYIEDYCRTAREELAEDLEAWKKETDDYSANAMTCDENLSERCHEIADSTVPVYNSILCEIAANNPALACFESELGPENNAIGHLQAAVYEYIRNDLYKYIQKESEKLEKSN